MHAVFMFMCLEFLYSLTEILPVVKEKHVNDLQTHPDRNYNIKMSTDGADKTKYVIIMIYIYHHIHNKQQHWKLNLPNELGFAFK